MSAARDSAPISPLAVAIASVLYGGSTFLSAPARADNPGVLEEVVVTARKRTESIQDIPASIDVFSKESIEKLAITQFEDYANRSPSLSFISAGPGTQYFFMRGASDGSNPESTSNSIAGYFLNDVSLSYYGGIPDLHLYDMQRIEVLNGPQGTLYGSGSMSGAVKLIANPPDPRAFSAGVDVDYSRYNAASGANHSEEGFVNIPLFDGSTAVRASAFYVKQAGFINNLLKTRTWVNGVVSDNSAWSGDNYNTQTFKGGRLALLHNINDKWKVSLSADYQAQYHKGAWDHDPARSMSPGSARNGATTTIGSRRPSSRATSASAI
jgi:iron complex outermembrane recepter protein